MLPVLFGDKKSSETVRYGKLSYSKEKLWSFFLLSGHTEEKHKKRVLFIEVHTTK